MLIRVPQHTQADLDIWAIRERTDDINARRAKFRVRTRDAIAEIRSFAERGPCYAGVSWGKDSVVMASLVVQLAREGGPIVPLVWVRVEPRHNPHCALVRDAFFAAVGSHPYEEVEEWCARGDDGGWYAEGTLERGFARARETHGGRHVSGVRGDESSARSMRVARYGLTTEHTCAPIGRWTGDDVFAYLYERNLPAHPAYAMSWGGRLDRERIRVATLGGKRGDGHGRATWEWHYYGWRLDQIGYRAVDVRPR